MGNPNITMEEYIRLQEEKALSRGETFNWQTATYVFDNTITPREALSWEPTKIISVNNLKTDSENDNDKVNMPSFPSPEPEVSYPNDLDFFKDFENEFPAIVYNDAITSKSDLLTEPTISPRHIDEFDLKNETSLPECDKKEQNVLYFKDLFPFNVIYPDDLKLHTDNDNDKIDIEKPSRDMYVIPSPNVTNVDTQGSNKLLETSHDTSNKVFKTETFIKNLNVNIMTCNHLSNGMSFIFLFKNLNNMAYPRVWDMTTLLKLYYEKYGSKNRVLAGFGIGGKSGKSIMGEPLSPDRVFDFPVDEPEPHPAYDFFTPGSLPGYVGNLNNNNGWIKADVPLLIELGVVADESMVGLIVDEIAEPIV
ncbi:hypothetical protein Tco_1054449 [Tanacetum coccineum]|uniref:Uncharacterized protein n=1 Tax=Tanacetum coccineum TaxID=301880 RepID=A0ABQ5GYW6_9ASTR